MFKRTRSWRQLLLGAAFVGSLPSIALAHHNVGHGPSESLRNLSTLASDPSPRQRAALLGQMARGTDEPTLNTATSYSATALIDIQLHKRFYFGGQFPLLIVDEDAATKTKFGYGNTTLTANVPIGSLKKSAASWVAGLSVSLPTRTVDFESDPGRQWIVTPGLRYGDTHRRLLWYALLLTPVETRPAGLAVDVSPAAGLGVRFFKKLSLTAGLNADIRALTVCETFDGSEVCTSGRATEVNRPTGALRAYSHFGTSFDFHRNWSAFAGAQLPLTSRRDIEWAANLGIEARF